MADKRMTQSESIVAYMKDYGGITQLEAIRDLGVMRLASRIADLKKKGYPIRTETVAVQNRFGGASHVSRYSLM